MLSFKGAHFPKDVILFAVFFYVRYTVSYRDLEEIMAELVEERFLDEERFARSFARGKFRMKQWGRVRIRRELKQRDISDYCIRQAMTEIDDAAYDNTLRELLRNRWQHYAQESDDFKRRQKTAAVALRRGFEPELVWSGLRQLTD